MSFTVEPAYWSTMQTLLIGPLLIVVCGTLAARLIPSARWQKIIWQATILATLWLLTTEMTGVAPALIDCCRARWVSDPLPGEIWRQPKAAVLSRLSFETMPNDPTVEPETARLEPGQPVLSRAAGLSANGRFTGTAGSQDLWQQALASSRSSSDGPALPVLASAPVAAPVPTVAPNALPVPALTALAAEAEEGVASSLTLNGLLPRVMVKLWILGTALLLAAWLWKRVRLAHFRRTSLRRAELSVGRCVADLAGRLRIRRRVAVHRSSRVTTPVTFGWLRPVIVVPEAFAAEFDEHQQQVILAHELAHVAAWDPLWQLPADLATILLWWHPSVWWANRCWRIVSEMAADDACLMVPDGPEILAESLVRMGRRWQAGWRLAGMAMTGLRFRSGLGRRVQRLLQLRLPGRSAPRPLATGSFSAVVSAVLSAMVLGVAISCTAWAHGPGTLTQGANPMKVFKINWRQSLAAAALSVWLGPATTDLLQAEPADENQSVAQEEPGEDERLEEEGDEEARNIIVPDESDEFQERDEATVSEVDEREGAARNVRTRAARPEEQRELEEEGRRLRRRLQSLRPDQDAEARALRWLRAQQDWPRSGERDRVQDRARREIGRLLSEQLNLRKQMENLERALAKRPDEQGLRDELAQVQRKLRLLQAKMGDRDVTRQRALQVLSELKLLHQNPLVDEETSSNLEVELALLLKQLRSLKDQDEAHEQRDHPLHRERPDVAPERVRRRSHLRAAIENLRAAGLHDQAEAIAQQFDEMIQQRTDDPFGSPANAAPVQRPEGSFAPLRQGPFRASVQGPEDPFGHPPQEMTGHPPQEMERTVRDLHERVQAMQEQLEQIRGQLQQLSEERGR